MFCPFLGREDLECQITPRRPQPLVRDWSLYRPFYYRSRWFFFVFVRHTKSYLPGPFRRDTSTVHSFINVLHSPTLWDYRSPSASVRPFQSTFPGLRPPTGLTSSLSSLRSHRRHLTYLPCQPLLLLSFSYLGVVRLGTSDFVAVLKSKIRFILPSVPSENSSRRYTGLRSSYPREVDDTPLSRRSLGSRLEDVPRSVS